MSFSPRALLFMITFYFLETSSYTTVHTVVVVGGGGGGNYQISYTDMCLH